MHRFFELFLAGIRAPISLFTVLAATVLLVLAGPFGTFDTLGPGIRTLYWGSVTISALLVAQALKAVQVIWWPTRNPWARGLVLGLMMLVFYTPILYGLALWLTGPYRTVTPLPLVAAVVFLVTYTIVLVDHFWNGPPPPEPEPRLLRRLGDTPADEILHVAARDHYVEVLTRAGCKRLLMRFSDALEEVEQLPGLRVHRSHWVARAAVERLARTGGQVKIVLTGGREVPVSRGYAHAVIEAFRDKLA